ncbi:MAG: hypothetical protein ACLQM6_08450 [Acidobacteriaceae bacterium]
MLSLAGGAWCGIAAPAQAPAPAATTSMSQLGTVNSISGNKVTLTTDQKQTITVSVPNEAKVVQLAVGSTDLKTGQPSQFSDIAVGDRVLATGKAGDFPGSLTARLVVVMKSAAIAQMQAAQQADWKARGTGGIVSSVDTVKGTIALESGSKKLTIITSSTTKFRRFEDGSVKYEDSKPGTLAQVRPKDQLQVLGNKSTDGLTIQAEVIMSGSFLNLSGLLTSIDQAAGTVTFKDLATKKIMTVKVTSNCDMHNIPLMTATMLANRIKGGGVGGGRGGRGGRGGGGGASGATGADAGLAAAGLDSTLGTAGTDAGANGAAGTAGQEDTAGAMRRSAGADLAQMMPRLPTIKLTDLKIGDAVMVVASEPSPGASTVEAITLLSGAEPILTANPNGGMSLGMSIGGGGGGGGE